MTPAFRRATIQTHMDLRDIKTCRRALFVRARLTRSIGPNSENIWGGVGLFRTDGSAMSAERDAPKTERRRAATACSAVGRGSCV